MTKGITISQRVGEHDGPTIWGGTPLSEFSEEQILRRILPLFPTGSDLLVAPGDDAAVLATPGRIIATTDTVVLGRDWLDEWSTGADIGHKVIAQNLADVAAMGGRPTGVLLTLIADPSISIEWVIDHAEGVAEACREAGVAVLGGDLSSAPQGVVSISVTALGNLTDEPVLRSGARSGDAVAVCGSLGLAAAGLRLLAADDVDLIPEAVDRQRRPQPPLAAGAQAAASGATSLIDLSDGLLRDAGRVAAASGVVIDLDTLAMSADLDRLAPLGRSVALECVLGGGEEHSLLATFPPDRMPPGWRAIGSVRALGPEQAPVVLVDGRALTDEVTSIGWDHFHA